MSVVARTCPARSMKRHHRPSPYWHSRQQPSRVVDRSVWPVSPSLRYRGCPRRSISAHSLRPMETPPHPRSREVHIPAVVMRTRSGMALSSTPCAQIPPRGWTQWRFGDAMTRLTLMCRLLHSTCGLPKSDLLCLWPPARTRPPFETQDTAWSSRPHFVKTDCGRFVAGAERLDWPGSADRTNDADPGRSTAP